MSVAPGKPVVAVVRSEGHYEGTREALSLLEDRIVDSIRGKRRVLVKPNFVSTLRQLAATHVDSVRAVLDTVSECYHGRIVLGEGPAIGSLDDGISNFGYGELEDEYGVDVVDLNQDDYLELEGVDSRLEPLKLRVSRAVLDSDYLISVAKPKTHDCVVVTLSIKNVVVGALVGKKEKDKIHQGTKAINVNIAKLAEKCMPNLAVIDGYVGMEGAGPVSGDPVRLGVSAASLHPVSLDSVMAKIMGFEPSDIGYLHYLDEWGVGEADIDGIEVIGESPDDVRRRFKPHPGYADQLKWR
ncbi:hypothetical protein AC482_01325 [miscellaneous Crenarchaeota group-15 archaeon DG-45]|uniref:DUF362 domain-containing protein n=1 Tax=miscellaneous Crenarchaeota group-15 archaeon DG-45 TaxID=1685127 RepID=A0A0M0BRR8_9ARCH|nr:MAG: hypothetical protein AC482_01325 [miscellaneous Crenarchaeota group-15 archaeon DG-45]